MPTFRLALWWALAGVLVAPLDALHVASGTIVRPPTGSLAEVPLFALGGVAVGLAFHFVALPLARLLVHLVPHPRPLSALRRGEAADGSASPLRSAERGRGRGKPEGGGTADFAFTVGAFVVAYAASSFVGAHTIVAAWLFAALALCSFALVPEERRVVAGLFSVGAAIVGPSVEGTLSSLGAFAYVHADVARVPAWLPALYLLTGPAVSFVDDAFVALAAKPSRLSAAVRIGRRGFARLASLRTSLRRRA